jgi:glutamyl-tRNA synthetase
MCLILDSIRSIDHEWGKGHEISYLVTIIEILKIRAKSLKDFVVQSRPFFEDPDKYDKVGLSKCWKDESVNKTIQSLLLQLDTITDWKSEEINKIIKSFVEQNQLSMGKITMPIRIAVFGSLSGPSVIEILDLLGKKVCMERLNRALDILPK